MIDFGPVPQLSREPQARELPPADLLEAIVDNTAEKLYEGSSHDAETSAKYTRVAIKTYEEESKRCSGCVLPNAEKVQD